jgi:hypothetical protein
MSGVFRKSQDQVLGSQKSHKIDKAVNLNLNFCNTRLTSLSRPSVQLSTNNEGKAYHSNPHLNTEIEALTKL